MANGSESLKRHLIEGSSSQSIPCNADFIGSQISIVPALQERLFGFPGKMWWPKDMNSRLSLKTRLCIPDDGFACQDSASWQIHRIPVVLVCCSFLGTRKKSDCSNGNLLFRLFPCESRVPEKGRIGQAKVTRKRLNHDDHEILNRAGAEGSQDGLQSDKSLVSANEVSS
jgi:hypothetical protein